MIKIKDIKKILKQQIFIIMLGTLLSKFLGLIRDTILANYYGAGLITDSYIIATTIPSILIGTLASAILTTFIPILNEEKTKGKEQQFTNNVTNISIVLVTVLIIIYYFFRRQIVSLFVIGFAEEELNVIINMTNITILVSYALVLISIFSGYLHSKNKYIATSFYGLVFNILSIIGIGLSYNRTYQIMPIMFLIGYVISLLILIINSIKYGYRYSFTFCLKSESIKKLFLLTLPVLFNSIVWDINVVIDKSLSSTVGTGYVSALNYSYKVVSVATGVIATSIAVYIFPKLSNFFQSQKETDFKNILTKSLLVLFILLIPITTFMIIFARPIIKVLFMRGNFDIEALEITKTALQLYSISIIPIGINTIIYKVFNSMQKNKVPATNAIISIAINIIFDIVLVKILGYKGIIIATAISNISASFLISYRAKKEQVKIDCRVLGKYLIKIAIATILATCIAALLYHWIIIGETTKIFIIGIIYCLTYLICLLAQKINFKNLKI